MTAPVRATRTTYDRAAPDRATWATPGRAARAGRAGRAAPDRATWATLRVARPVRRAGRLARPAEGDPARLDVPRHRLPQAR